MDIEKPFASYAELELHEKKLRIRSETAALRFGSHFNALADKEVRSTLFKGAVSNAVDEINPMGKAAELMTNGGIASQLLMGVFTRKGGLAGRMLGSVATVVLPNLLAKVPWGRALAKLSGVLRKEHRMNGNGAR